MSKSSGMKNAPSTTGNKSGRGRSNKASRISSKSSGSIVINPKNDSKK